MSPTLYNPHTARAINVSDRQAAEWRDLGWLDDKPEKGDAEAPCQPAPDAQTEGGDSPTDNDPPEGDYSRPLQLLARSLEFVDPLTTEPRVFESQQRLIL